MKPILTLLIAVVATCVSTASNTHRCYNPASNSFIPEGGAYRTSVNLYRDSTSIVASYILGTIDVVESQDRVGLYYMTMPDFGNPNNPSKPYVPVRADFFSVDGKATNFKLAIVNAHYQEFPLTVAAAQQLRSESAENVIEPSVAPINSTFLPCDSLAFLDVWGIMGDKTLLSVVINPVQYDSELNLVRVYDEFIYSIDWDNDSTISSDVFSAKRPTLNLGDTKPISLRYLIISHPDYENVLQDFVEWKTLTGFTVTTRFSDSWTTESVRSAILEESIKSKGLDYILLVGNENVIPGFHRIYHWPGEGTFQYITDFDYALLDNDQYQDAYTYPILYFV